MFLPAQLATAEPAPTVGAGVGLSVASTLELPCPVSLLDKHESGNIYGMVIRPLCHQEGRNYRMDLVQYIFHSNGTLMLECVLMKPSHRNTLAPATRAASALMSAHVDSCASRAEKRACS